MDMDMDPVADAVGRLAAMAAASLGETVVVLTNELAEFESDDEEPLLLLLLPLLPLLRMRVEMMSTWMSIKVSSGPATIALLCRSMEPPFKG